ncbi:hypothetical protein BGW38_008154 [Lunasporangiospora selenospora]|uniref:Uncharacterized protein n=1 Tax=Lunasporangiospora selenospora TaxID=979761 RepID=A0A9P6FYS2_9FUNG|nr:hypothetical protein BGW38_008154 [Lunasporangiospora selenospora]
MVTFKTAPTLDPTAAQAVWVSPPLPVVPAMPHYLQLSSLSASASTVRISGSTVRIPDSRSQILSSNGTSNGTSNGSRSRSSRRNSIASGCLRLDLLAAMREEFKWNFDNFKGEPWVLPSGQRLDDVTLPNVLGPTTESLMHPCIIDNVEAMTGLVEEQVDKDELLRALGGEDGDDRAWQLAEAEQAFISLYQYELPPKQSESWHISNQWNVLNEISTIPKILQHHPGEICCVTSGRRKNGQRATPLIIQLCGRKADGVIKSDVHELAVMEAAKIDNGPQGTKVMVDTLKLGKMMKDCYDVIRRDSRKNVHETLATFGMGIGHSDSPLQPPSLP